MISTRYLLLAGGLGNIYYQLNQVKKLVGGNVKSCTILYAGCIRRLLSHTQPLHRAVVISDRPSMVVQSLILFIAFFDILFFRIFGRTVLTVLDTTHYKYDSPAVDLIYYGYFQSLTYGDFDPEVGLENLLFLPKPIEQDMFDCIHFRFGDYMLAYQSGSRRVTNMPAPDLAWFEDACERVACVTGSLVLYVVTDNIEGAREFFDGAKFSKYSSVRFQSLDLIEDLARLSQCKGLVNYNSTLSLMIFGERESIEVGCFGKYLETKALSKSGRDRAIFL